MSYVYMLQVLYKYMLHVMSTRYKYYRRWIIIITQKDCSVPLWRFLVEGIR